MGRLIIYDTTNFIDFPIGGELTSVRNFLLFLSEKHSRETNDVLLVGVTLDPAKVGHFAKIKIGDAKYTFLPVACAEEDLFHRVHSLRLKYVKGLLTYGHLLKIRKNDCNYIQTPEAYGPVKLLCPWSKVVIFSHGSYANMERGFRFFQKNILVKKVFTTYLKMVIHGANLIFVLDKKSYADYRPYQKHLVRAGNSIALPDNYNDFDVQQRTYRGKMLFVGRLSKDKGIGPMIEAAYKSAGPLSLTIVGDGEHRGVLKELDKKMAQMYPEKKGCVCFAGAVPPKKVAEYMDASDVLVMNSAFEGVPMTILEAFGHGLPVITTDVGGIGDTVSFGKDAVCTDGTAESILGALEAVSHNYRAMAQNAHDHGAAYDYRVINEKVYQALCRNWNE